MDDLRLQARNEATSKVARDFEPTRIERQLLAHAFELVYEIHTHTVPKPPQEDEQSIVEQPAAIDMGRKAA